MCGNSNFIVIVIIIAIVIFIIIVVIIIIVITIYSQEEWSWKLVQNDIWPLLLTWINFNSSMEVITSIIKCGIFYQLPNSNGVTVDVWEWISNFIPRFKGHVITG